MPCVMRGRKGMRRRPGALPVPRVILRSKTILLTSATPVCPDNTPTTTKQWSRARARIVPRGGCSRRRGSPLVTCATEAEYLTRVGIWGSRQILGRRRVIRAPRTRSPPATTTTAYVSTRARRYVRGGSCVCVCGGVCVCNGMCAHIACTVLCVRYACLMLRKA